MRLSPVAILGASLAIAGCVEPRHHARRPPVARPAPAPAVARPAPARAPVVRPVGVVYPGTVIQETYYVEPGLPPAYYSGYHDRHHDRHHDRRASKHDDRHSSRPQSRSAMAPRPQQHVGGVRPQPQPAAKAQPQSASQPKYVRHATPSKAPAKPNVDKLNSKGRAGSRKSPARTSGKKNR